MLLKICGLTRSCDIPPAVAAGATHLGFVFAEHSPRNLSAEEARALIDTLPEGVEAVGVFSGVELDDVVAIAEQTGLRTVQLHGGYQPEDITALKARGLAVIWALPVQADGSWEAIDAAPDYYLLDTSKADRFGGTGTAFDWSAATRPDRPFFVAGGLKPANLHRAAAALRPAGLDLSSGVEAAPGIKSHERLRALGAAIQIVRAREAAESASHPNGTHHESYDTSLKQ